MAEFWSDIDEAPNYVVSSLGRVKNVLTGRVLKTRPASNGYICVDLRTATSTVITRNVHRLVAKAFYEDVDPSLEVNHEDGIKTNNFIANLEWNTHSQNILHAFRTGLNRGVTGQRVRVVETGEVFDSQHECARVINGRQSDIWKCLNGLQHTHRGYTFERVD